MQMLRLELISLLQWGQKSSSRIVLFAPLDDL